MKSSTINSLLSLLDMHFRPHWKGFTARAAYSGSSLARGAHAHEGYSVCYHAVTPVGSHRLFYAVFF